MKGNYSTQIENIINEYLRANYNLDTKSLDDVIKNILVNYSKINEVNIDGINFLFADSIISNTVQFVAGEINYGKEYDFKNMAFNEGDTVIDIGGNIGMVSIYLAKKYPFLKIYAYEPLLQNYENFVYNIKLNNIPDGTIHVENKAVTCDGREVGMSINALNTGGSSISDVISVGAINQEINNHVQSTTLHDIFKTHKINKLRLLKIDCEGSEYEILHNTDREILKNIQTLRGEFHENKNLTDKYDVDELYNFISQYITDIKVVKARGCFVM